VLTLQVSPTRLSSLQSSFLPEVTDKAGDRDANRIDGDVGQLAAASRHECLVVFVAARESKAQRGCYQESGLESANQQDAKDELFQDVIALHEQPPPRQPKLPRRPNVRAIAAR
jgi:hypothetical protein